MAIGEFRVRDDLPRSRLGEGPLWDVETGWLYWVDIEGHAIHRHSPSRGTCESHPVGAPTGFALVAADGGLVAGIADGVYELAFGEPQRRLLARPDMHAENRFNDAACDPRGRLWAGTMHREASRDMVPTGALYRLGPDGIDAVETGVAIANGLGWSPDGTMMYFADTHRGCIFAYDYDLAHGQAGQRRVFAWVPIEVGVPDGLTVDAAGRVIVAIWRGARLNVYAADGRLDEVIAVPVANPTSCCLGGDGLATLFVTTATAEGDPRSGHLLERPADVPGLPSVRMAMPLASP